MFNVFVRVRGRTNTHTQTHIKIILTCLLKIIDTCTDFNNIIYAMKQVLILLMEIVFPVLLKLCWFIEPLFCSANAVIDVFDFFTFLQKCHSEGRTYM